MTTRPTNEPVTPVTADIDRYSVVEVPLLLREADLVKLAAWADRRGMTTGQLLRQVIGLYLAAGITAEVRAEASDVAVAEAILR